MIVASVVASVTATPAVRWKNLRIDTALVVSSAPRPSPSRKASAFHGWQKAPDSPALPRLSGSRGGSCAWSVRPDRQSCRTGPSFRSLLRGKDICAQTADQLQFGLEIDVMRQLDMFQKARGLHVIGMHQHEFLILRGRTDVLLAQFLPAQGAIDQGHGDLLALGLAKHQPIAT